MPTDQQLLDSQTITPAEITPAILALCRDILKESGAAPAPVYVPVEPEPGGPLDRCFTITAEKVAHDGGLLQQDALGDEGRNARSGIPWGMDFTRRAARGRDAKGAWREAHPVPDPVRRHDGAPRINWRVPLGVQPHIVEYVQYRTRLDRVKAGFASPADAMKLRVRYDKAIMRIQQELIARARREQNPNP